MGSNPSLFLPNQQLPHQYKPVKLLPGVYQNILNGSRIQKHKIQLSTEEQIIHQQDIFFFRKINSEYIINVYYFSQSNSIQHLCRTPHQLCYYTEYPSYVISLDLHLTIQQGLNLFITCLKGFELLFNKFGPFHITNDTIFFNNNHQPKVWISADLTKTKIGFKMGHQASQQKMVRDLLHLFYQLNNNQSQKSMPFGTYLYHLQQKNKTKLTFRNIIKYLLLEAEKLITNKLNHCQTSASKKTNSSTTKQSINNQSYQSINNNGENHYQNHRQNYENILLQCQNRDKSNEIDQKATISKFLSPRQSLKKDGNGQRFSLKQHQKPQKYSAEQNVPSASITTRNNNHDGTRNSLNCQSTFTVFPTSPFTQKFKNTNFRTTNDFPNYTHQIDRNPPTQYFYSEAQEIEIDKNKITIFKQITPNDLQFKAKLTKMQKNQRNTKMKNIELENPPFMIQYKQNTNFSKTTPLQIDHTHILSHISPIRTINNNFPFKNVQL